MRFSYGIALILLSVGCADRTTVDVPVSHPANPDAAEAAHAPASTTSAPPAESSPPATTTDHREHAPAADASVTSPAATVDAHADASAPAADDFTCQMHPKISQKEAGRCPICHMKLKPRSQLKDAP